MKLELCCIDLRLMMMTSSSSSSHFPLSPQQIKLRNSFTSYSQLMPDFQGEFCEAPLCLEDKVFNRQVRSTRWSRGLSCLMDGCAILASISISDLQGPVSYLLCANILCDYYMFNLHFYTTLPDSTRFLVMVALSQPCCCQLS